MSEETEHLIITAVCAIAAAPRITLREGNDGYRSGERPDWFMEGIHDESHGFIHGEVAPIQVADLRTGARLNHVAAGCATCEDGYHTTPTGAGRCIIVPAVVPGNSIPELSEAAHRIGVAYLAEIPETPEDPRRKIILGGAGDGTAPGRAPIEAFLGGWAASQGLTDLYGDPALGFAGGYRK